MPNSNVELAFEKNGPRKRRRPLLDALELGAWHGAWTITVGSLPASAAYVLRYGWMDLPWAALAAQLGSFVAVTGALYGAGIALGETLAREACVPGPLRPLLAVAAPALGGALFGLAPGAFAAEQFGRLSAPYFGTIEILVVGVLAFFLLGATLLRAEGVPPFRIVPALGLALVAPLVLTLGIWAVAPSTAWLADAIVLDTADMAPSLAVFGAGFGALIGMLFGALLGFARTLLVYHGEPVSGRFRRRASRAGPARGSA